MCCCMCNYHQQGGKVIQTEVVAAAEGEVLVRFVYFENVMPTVIRLEGLILAVIRNKPPLFQGYGTVAR